MSSESLLLFISHVLNLIFFVVEDEEDDIFISVLHFGTLLHIHIRKIHK